MELMEIGRIEQRCRKVALSVVFIFFCLPTWALDLQEVEINSRLNQPLQFTLGVLQDSRVVAQELQVSIADAATYQQRGLEYNAFLNDIVLTVVGEGGLQIEGSSTRALKEPVLYLLIELQWPGGSSLVQRSVIVDLPAKYLPPQETELDASAESVEPEPVAEPLPIGQGEQLHRVQRGEVLSLVAAEYRGPVDIPLHRYMRAIQQLNATAFPAGLDQLSPGQAIRMPDPLELLADTAATLPSYEGASSIDYIVQYGDKFSLLAQHFRGNADMPLKAYMQQIVAANSDVLDMSGASLKSGMLLHIPRPQVRGERLDATRERQAVLTELLAQPEVQIVNEPSTPDELQEAIDAEVLKLENSLKQLEQARLLRQALVKEQPAADIVPENTPTVTTDLNAYKDVVDANDLEQTTELVVEPKQKKLSSVSEKSQENTLRQWIIYALWVVLLIIVVVIAIALIKALKGSGEELELSVLPSLLPEPTEHEEDLLDDDSMQDSIALLDVDEPEQGEQQVLDHQATLRMNAGDYLQQKPAVEGVASFSSAEQNDVENLIAKEDFPAATKKVDQLIYSQSGDLKNWLLKLELLAKQGKKERCYTLATQVRGSFKSAVQQLQVDQLLDQYFSGATDADDFVPETYNPEASRKKNAAAELASETAEVRVYLSYGFYDMAEQALEKLMQDFPRHIDLRILNLEVLLGMGNEARLRQASESLLQGAAKLTQAQEYQVKELMERAENMAAVEAAPQPSMDLDLSEPSVEASSADESEHGVVGLDFTEDEMAHLDIGTLDLESDIADALHREEDAYHQAHDETGPEKSGETI